MASSKKVPQNRRSLRFAPPNFLSTWLALAKVMRLSLRKGASVDVASSAWREIRVRSGRDDKEGVACLCHVGCWWSELQIPPRHAGTGRLRSG